MPHRDTKKITAVLLILVFLSTQVLVAEVAPYDDAQVNAFDRMLMYPYSEDISLASDITQYSAFLAPASLALAAPPSDWFGISLAYGAAAGLSFGTRTFMKMAIERNRPYMYFDCMPPVTSDLYRDLIADQDDSFPSGHSIMAFTGAAFTQAVYSLRYPDSPYKRASTITAWTLAGATAALRVASGNHFITDVLAGAAIGTFFGYGVPYLAWKVFPSWKGEKVSVAVGPAMFTMHVQL